MNTRTKELTIEYQDEILLAFQKQKEFALELRNSTAAQRIQKLKTLKEVIEIYSSDIRAALQEDFQKAGQETDITEILPTIQEIEDACRNLPNWMKPKTVDSPLTLFGTSAEIQYQPKGVCLIISPWNYPFMLAFSPLVSAVAAGNTVILKPSEYTPNITRVMKTIIHNVFDQKEVILFEGDGKVAEFLTQLPFDHIFFTGSTNVGKLVMKNAALNLASVTLELGGKSPAIIDENCDVHGTAERIFWGKSLNAGQTCVAPDYALVNKNLLPKFVEALKLAEQTFYGTNEKPLKENPDFCRIINSKNHARLTYLVEDALRRGAKLELGTTPDPDTLFFPPTVLTNVPEDAEILKEEIFGPILPILTYKNIEEAIHYVNSKPKPLALYVFSRSEKFIEKVLKNTSSGGACVNDVIIHLANPNLPFGGVNHSGHGSYHGFFGFKAFSHERAVLKQGPVSTVRLLYPPYTLFVDRLYDFMKKFMI